MSNHYFQFKQFTVWHDRCAMKIGTDGVLLGAWAPAEGARRVLDVGTGSGLIALQMAQRLPEAQIVAIELDPSAAGQAAENFAASPWSDRLEVVCDDFAHFTACLFNIFIAGPQVFVCTLVAWIINKSIIQSGGYLNYHYEYSFFIGAACLLIATAITAKIKEV